jgi:hypothetical protein
MHAIAPSESVTAMLFGIRRGSIPDKFQSGTSNESLIVNGGRVHPTWKVSHKLHVKKNDSIE